MGFYIKGYYVGCETREFKNDDGSISAKVSINLATGSLAYRVYLADDEDLDRVMKLKIGQELLVSLRVYVSKAGRLSCVDGRIENAA